MNPDADFDLERSYKRMQGHTALALLCGRARVPVADAPEVADDATPGLGA